MEARCGGIEPSANPEVQVPGGCGYGSVREDLTVGLWSKKMKKPT
jgi:hypothetical protein